MQIEQAQSMRWRERRSEAVHRSLDHLLAMAHRYRREGNLRQAMEMYWMLTEDHSGAEQALEAQECLLDLAENYERDEARHTARAVYERIL